MASSTILAVAASAALVFGAPAFGAEPAAAPPAPPAAPAAATPTPEQELMQIQQRLSAAEQKVLQDPAVQARQKELQGKMEAAIEEIEPTFDAQVARLTALQTELQGLRSGDPAAAQKLFDEGQQIQQRLEAAQAKVLQAEPLATEVQAFQEALRTEMRKVEPATDQLLARAKALVAQLEGAG